MMASLVRIGLTRLCGQSGLLSGKVLCPDAGGAVAVTSVRTIYSKTSQPERFKKRPAPYDYKTKPFTKWHSLFDGTTSRFDENTKIILVEGPLAAGKSAFAKQLADELGMLYLPEANHDMIYINDIGYDLRKLDDQLPEGVRSFDVHNFMRDPKNRLTGGFQIRQYSIKYSQYIDALAHLLSTGQGVVLDRSVYSDFVFIETMYKQKYVSKGVKSAYYDVRKNTIGELMHPQLIIYLDVPVPKVMDNIKKRNISYEVNSPVINAQYLTNMEHSYKQNYLKEISNHGELLIYDWSTGGDLEVVIEDMERIDFNRFDVKMDSQLQDWMWQDEEDWEMKRHKYADKKVELMSLLDVPRYDVPELIVEAEDGLILQHALDAAPGEKYEKGYDPRQGDSFLFKTAYAQRRDTLPALERTIQS